MDRKKLLLFSPILAGLIIAIGALGFKLDPLGVNLHPERELTARDQVALAFAVALLEEEQKRWGKYGYVAPTMAKGEKATNPAFIEKHLDEIMRVSYGMANSFLRVKVSVQEELAADAIKAGLVTTAPEREYKKSVGDFMGNPSYYRDSSGTFVPRGFYPPTPTPTPNPGQ